jgi:hypothetical protein
MLRFNEKSLGIGVTEEDMGPKIKPSYIPASCVLSSNSLKLSDPISVLF